MGISISQLFSFTNWATSQPSSPLPGDKVDQEFSAVRAAITALSVQVDDVRRSDGALKNGLVTETALASGLVTSLTSSFRTSIQTDLAASTGAASTATSAATSAQASATAASASAAQAAASASILSTQSGSVLAQISAASSSATAASNAATAAAASVSTASGAAANNAALSENWADVSVAWAEHMPGTIPPNILATMGITGDHWSSRWWANYTDQKVAAWETIATPAVASLEDFNARYLGAYPANPTLDNNGDALTPGALYFSTTSNVLKVWTGTAWQAIISETSVSSLSNIGAGLAVYKDLVAGVARMRTLTFGANFTTTLGADEIDVVLTSVEWSKLTGKPTTIAGYGISDAYTKGEIDTKVSDLQASDATLTSAVNARVLTTTYTSGQAAQDAVIATKADTAYVDGQDAALTAQIATKAATTYVDSQNATQDAAIALRVPITSSTGAASLPTGTTAQRPTGSTGYIRFNTTLSAFEGYNGSNWTPVGGGATGGGTDAIFHLNDQTITTNYEIPAGKNAGTFGPVTAADGIVVAGSDGSTWSII